MRGHDGSVLDLSFSRDGNWLASASMDRTVRIWQVHTAKRPRARRAHSGPAFHAVSRAGQHALSAGHDDKRIRLWAGPLLEAGTSLRLEGQLSALAISSDGMRAFIGTEDGKVLQWIPGESTFTRLLEGNGVIAGIAISPDQKTLAAIGIRGDLQVCELANPIPKCAVVYLLGSWGSSVAISEDGRWIGAASGTEGTRGLGLVWDVKAGKATRLEGHLDRISSIQFDREGTRAVTASWDGTARIWDLATGSEIARLLGPKEAPKARTGLAGFSPGGDWVATSSYDRTLRLWPAPRAPSSLGTTPKMPIIMDASSSVLVSDGPELGPIAFDPSNNTLAASLATGEIHLWDVPARKLSPLRKEDVTLRVVLEGDGSAITNFVIHGSRITATTQKGGLLEWTLSPGLALNDDLLLSYARSVLPLSGSLAGKLERSFAGPSTAAQQCPIPIQRHLGLPPHRISGAARARLPAQTRANCESAETKSHSDDLLAGLLAASEGDYTNALQKFMAAAQRGEHAAEIGLGDIYFVDALTAGNFATALHHYTLAREHGVRSAASRLGWITIARGESEDQSIAKGFFEESAKTRDADGFAGLAWLGEQFGGSPEDLEKAFSDYVIAQYLYEQDHDLVNAKEIAERRSTLAQLIQPHRLAGLFLAARGWVAP